MRFWPKSLLPAACTPEAQSALALGMNMGPPFLPPGQMSTQAPPLQRPLGLRANTWGRGRYFSSLPQNGRQGTLTQHHGDISKKRLPGHGQTKGLCVTSGHLVWHTSEKGLQVTQVGRFRKLERAVPGPAAAPSPSPASCLGEGPRQRKMTSLFIIFSFLAGSYGASNG